MRSRRIHGRSPHILSEAPQAVPQLIWTKAEGCRVWDAEGRDYIDLTGGFGVAALGHRNPKIAAAIAEAPVVHALGDLAEAEVTQRFRDALPWPAKLGVTGEDAVEIALRTALLATGRPGIVAFDGAYHGTGLLALAATGLQRFREPFAPWLPGPVYRRTYGDDPGALPDDVGVVIVEPVQGRAGARVPPDDFLPALRKRCDEVGAVLVVDAIFTGLGRIGEMWPGSDVADVLCVGKALGGGLPISAALFVRPELEQVWDFGEEDLYTHTHSGNPLACAAALVVLDEVPKLLPRVAVLSDRFASAGWEGKGLLRTERKNAAEAERIGVLVIPIPASEVRPELIQAAPPFTLTDDELNEVFVRLEAP